MRFIWTILILLALGLLLIISNNNLALYKIENLQELGRLSLSWFSQVYENLQTLTGSVIEMNWTLA